MLHNSYIHPCVCVDEEYKNKKEKDLFNIFIMKYLLKRNVQVEPAQ